MREGSYKYVCDIQINFHNKITPKQNKKKIEAFSDISDISGSLNKIVSVIIFNQFYYNHFIMNYFIITIVHYIINCLILLQTIIMK